MNINKHILVVAGEPNSIFLEIFFKTLKKLKIKKPIILIASRRLVEMQMRKLKCKKKIKIIEKKNLLNLKFYNKNLKLIKINYIPSRL